MSGIISYGAYIPYNRLQRETIARALETRAGKGERAVSSFDEDTVTMAVEAAYSCLRNGPDTQVSSLFFATTDPPYQEKLNAATLHAALSLPKETRALDLGGSARAGLTTLMTAADASSSGRANLAAVSDVRLGAPEGAAEQGGGDGAAAFLLGTENLIAEIKGSYSETLEHIGLWRLPGEYFAKTWEERFTLSQVYAPLLGRAIAGLLENAGVKADDLSAIILDVPNARAIPGGLKAAGVAPEKLVNPLLESVGHTGTAHAGILLASALDNASPGDLIAVVSVSDGADAILLEATAGISSFTNGRSVQSLVDSKRNDLSYTRFLKWRGIMPSERPRRPDPSRPSAPAAFRSKNWKFGFIGSECLDCGARHLPPQAVCVACGSTGGMKEIPFSDRTAKITTYTLDHLAFSLQPPMVSAIIDFDGGGRMEIEITDCDPEKVDIGLEVEMSFRRLFTADGIHNYFWKARPVR